MECPWWSVAGEVWMVECRRWSVEDGVLQVECGWWNVVGEVWMVEC